MTSVTCTTKLRNVKSIVTTSVGEAIVTRSTSYSCFKIAKLYPNYSFDKVARYTTIYYEKVAKYFAATFQTKENHLWHFRFTVQLLYCTKYNCACFVTDMDNKEILLVDLWTTLSQKQLALLYCKTILQTRFTPQLLFLFISENLFWAN